MFMSVLIIIAPPCHCMNGQLAITFDGVTVKSPLAFASRTSFFRILAAVDATPFFHSTMFIFPIYHTNPEVVYQ